MYVNISSPLLFFGGGDAKLDISSYGTDIQVVGDLLGLCDQKSS